MAPRRPLAHIASLLLALLASACASLDEGECRTGDWRQLGYVDGLKGYAMSRLADHDTACARYGVVPDRTAWQLGYVEGQVRYCTARNGYEQGRDGKGYANVCPPSTDIAFRPAWEDGRRVAAALDTLGRIDSRLREIADTLAEDDRRSAVYLDAARENREPAERPVLLTRGERKALDREYDGLALDYEAVQADLAALDAELSARHGAVPLQPVLRNF
ncbi:MAG: DUF2799 domain-containing protein [Sinimarinibacterium flocculans]|uniref:DUF2799 domain-containing protein n=1 Tax=Sinimarinibacterium flocculans TaxID=985250 RepID=UPI003C3C690B